MTIILEAFGPASDPLMRSRLIEIPETRPPLDYCIRATKPFSMAEPFDPSAMITERRIRFEFTGDYKELGMGHRAAIYRLDNNSLF